MNFKNITKGSLQVPMGHKFWVIFFSLITVGCLEKSIRKRQPACNKVGLEISTNLNGSMIKSIQVCKHQSGYFHDSLSVFEERLFTQSQEKGLEPPNWFVSIQDSVSNGQTLSIRITVGDSVYRYDLRNITVDTVPVYKGILCTIKGYYLNGMPKDKSDIELQSSEGRKGKVSN